MGLDCSCASERDEEKKFIKPDENPLDLQKKSKIKQLEELNPKMMDTITESNPAQEEKNHEFSITFKKVPLDIFTSSSDGKCVYVTRTNLKKNKALQKHDWPEKSRLLRVNG